VKVTICDVGPRDGLQNEPEPLSAQVRAELVNRLAAAGVPRIEAASFVHPERVPQMAGAEGVVAGIEPRDGTIYAGLVLNERGYERLATTALGEVHFSFGATETFNRRNANASVDESVAAAARISERARSDGRTLVVSISVAFGCPFEGEVAPAHVLELAERIVAGGADEVVLADTIGGVYRGR
jgi:isopropylmalate/homocitrate/citramalate synthase